MLHAFLLSFVVKTCHGETICSNQQECKLISNLSDDEVECRGFASCLHAQNINTSLFYGQGSYSAYGASNVVSTGVSYCYGDSSCRNIVNFTSHDTNCNGYRSCFGSTIELPNSITSDQHINYKFNGDESGAFTTLNLHQSTNITAYGRLSLHESIINMYSPSIIHAVGFASLSGATLYCETGQFCQVSCHDYGCYNVSISSFNGDGDYLVDCSDNMIPNALCYGDDVNNISVAALNDLLSVHDLTQIGFDNVDTYLLCLNSSILGINCGDYSECQFSIFNYENEAICCSAHNGCFYTSTTLTVNLTSTTSISDELANMIGIYCGGYLSCNTGRNDKFIIVNENINENDYNYNISQSFGIFCDGAYGCNRLHLSGADNLLCRGMGGCHYSIVDTIKNVFVFGFYGAHGANISSISGNIYCMGVASCQYATFSEISGNIYGISHDALDQVIISNTKTITNKIYVIGNQLSNWIAVHNVKSIFASGNQVLQGGIVSGLRNLNVSGRDSLSGSVLTTKIIIMDEYAYNTSIGSDSKVTLYIDGTNSETYNVTCSTGDECYIHCQSNTGCTNMILTCKGVCYLNCGNYSVANGNDCPSTIIGVWYPLSTSPTMIPTDHPTRNHTTSYSPTIIPEMSTTMFSNNDDTTSDDNDVLVLILVIIILVVIFCAVCVISIICINGLNKTKKYELEKKQIQLDIIKQFNLIKNDKNNIAINNPYDKSKFAGVALNGVVNLQSSTSTAGVPIEGIVKVDTNDDDMEVDAKDNKNSNNYNETGRQTVSISGDILKYHIKSTEGQT